MRRLRQKKEPDIPCFFAGELHSLSLASDMLQRLQRLDIGENAGLALSGAVGPTQDLQGLLLSLGRLELLAMDHCGASDVACSSTLQQHGN